MKRIVIELEDDFHKRVKLQAVMADKSVKGYIKELLEVDLQQKEKEQTR